jgi:ribosomal protein S18 acetylase RimI-like enzyme
MDPTRLILRPVEDSDLPFLLQVYASTRAQEMELVPWTPEQKDQFVGTQFQAQSAHYAAEHPRASHSIVTYQEAPIGRLYLDREPEVFHILDLTLMPENRNRGAGSFLLRSIMAEAKDAGKPVTIYVETFNRSLQLFRRLGFKPVGQEGFHLLMQWSAQDAQAAIADSS